ncbi:TRAP transporter substrate-binding protein [Prochlorothrix hollandica]|uniref:TRAP transporter substrate-binding protein n=1 Tax=Prochlorothrix hollandica TaxID=1223 RepID=UPI00333F6572
MKRRQLLGYTATGAATAALASCGTTNPEASSGTPGALPPVKWQMTTSWPNSLDTLQGSALYVAERVAALSGGRFTIEVFAAGELVPGLQVLDAVQSGTVQCGHSPTYYYVGKNSALAFGTALPFGLNAQQQNAWLYHGGGIEAMNDILASFNTIAFPAGNTGTQMGGWFKREIKTVADLQGLKMRIPGLGGQVLSRLGVNPQILPGGEVFLALERGAIDAAEWVGPYDDEKLGLHKAAPFYYAPGWWEPGATLHLMINLDAWNQLPPPYQAMVQTAAAEANQHCLSLYDTRNPEALQRLLAQGTQLRSFSPEILAACQKEAFALYGEMAAENPQFQAIFDPWQKFRETIYQWHGVAELGFSSFVMQSPV